MGILYWHFSSHSPHFVQFSTLSSSNFALSKLVDIKFEIPSGKLHCIINTYLLNPCPTKTNNGNLKVHFAKRFLQQTIPLSNVYKTKLAIYVFSLAKI